MDKIKYIKEFKGGSMAKTFLIEKNNKLLVRKVVEDTNNGLGVDKLLKQVNWILELEKDIANAFPKIIESNFNKTYGYYSMEFHDMPTFKDYILKNNDITLNIQSILKDFISFGAKIASKTYLNKNNGINYVKDKHLNKMFERCEIVCSQNKIFHDLFHASKLIINDKEYLNIHELFKLINNDTELLQLLSPKTWHRSHGDFTLQNILTNGKEFKIIDPRGEGEDSIYYDISKLYQSTHGKYDLLYENNYECHFENNVINYKIYENELLFNDLHDLIKTHIPAFFNLEKEWDLITRFYEASHFIAMAPFRYEEDLERTVLCYVIGIKIMNEMLMEWKQKYKNGGCYEQ